MARVALVALGVGQRDHDALMQPEIWGRWGMYDRTSQSNMVLVNLNHSKLKNTRAVEPWAIMRVALMDEGLKQFWRRSLPLSMEATLRSAECGSAFSALLEAAIVQLEQAIIGTISHAQDQKQMRDL